MERLAQYLSGVVVEEPRFIRNIMLYPLLGPDVSLSFEIRGLDELGAERLIEIGELSPPQVERVRFENRSDFRALLLDGEELTGALQNRILNTAGLVERQSSIALPVSCVEQGRWSGSRYFGSGETCSYPSLRALLCRSVSQSLASARGFSTDQHLIWSSVAKRLSSFKVRSYTSSMHDLYTSLKDELARYLDDLDGFLDFNGVIAALNHRILCLDYFGQSELFKRFAKKLLASYLVDALDAPSSGSSNGAAKRFWELILKAKAQKFPSVGLGDELRFSSSGILGRALLFGPQLLHLAAFPARG
jgi:hypothetical protein